MTLAVTTCLTEHLVEPLGLGVSRPRVSWGRRGDGTSSRQRAYAIEVASSADLLTAGAADVWRSGRVEEGGCSLVRLGGPPLRSREQRWWRVMMWDENDQPSEWSPGSSFEAGLDPADWRGEWISAPAPDFEHDGYRPVPMLRREVAVPADCRRARLYVTALGAYRASINGMRVGTDELRPGWTDYSQRVQYQAYDVTALLASGENVIGVELAEGWYSGHLGVACARETYGPEPMLLAQLEVELQDGPVVTVTTDESWRAAYGPLLRSDLLLGEIQDARRVRSGWDRPGFDPSGWSSVVVTPVPRARHEPSLRPTTHLPTTSGTPASVAESSAAVVARASAVPTYDQLVATRSEPVRVVRTIPALSVTCPVFQTFVFDFGQNLVGWTQLSLDVPEGAEIVVRHGEALNADGTLYTANLRLAEQTERYISAGGQQVFEPRFTFHGFRYAEVVVDVLGLPVEAMTAVVAHSDMRQVGSFACSSPMLNQLQSNIEWGMRGNFLEVPTDCPQRNERLGWLGDARIFSPTALFNFDATAFFGKWLEDVRLARTPDGIFPDFAPWVGPFAMDGAPGWADGGVFIPWHVYESSGDTELLRECYPAMAQFVELLHKENPGLIRRARRGVDWGDWLSLPEADPSIGRGSGPIIDSVHSTTDKDVFATSFFAQSASLTAAAAQVLGLAEDVARFTDLARDVRAAFVAEFVDADGRIRSGTQTAYSLALCFDLLPPGLAEAAGAHLAQAVERAGRRLTTGISGTGLLLPALVRAGRVDLAYAVLLSEEYPSWGYSIKHGATTIWERWDGWTEEGGFQDIRMNSLNHYALGAVGDFLYTTVAGLRCGAPGWTRAIVQPRPGPGVTWAEARYDSPSGEYAVRWETLGTGLKLNVQVPVSCRATVLLEGSEPIELGPGAHEVTR